MVERLSLPDCWRAKVHQAPDGLAGAETLTTLVSVAGGKKPSLAIHKAPLSASTATVDSLNDGESAGVINRRCFSSVFAISFLH